MSETIKPNVREGPSVKTQVLEFMKTATMFTGIGLFGHFLSKKVNFVHAFKQIGYGVANLNLPLLRRFFTNKVLAVTGVAVGLLAWVNSYFNGRKNIYTADLSGKVVVITGANTGIGYETAKEMAKLQPKALIFACRNQQKAEKAIAKIKKNKTSLQFMKLDLSDLNSVRAFADSFNKKFDRLDILLNNAGIMAMPLRKTTKQGHERQFGVNHLGHYLLTRLLTDTLNKTKDSRIVNVSSGAHRMFKNTINFNDLMSKKSYVPWEAYAQSKLSNILFTKYLAETEGMQACSLHPGVVRTELGRHMFPTVWEKIRFYAMYPIFCLFTKTPWYGAQTQLHCCLIPINKFHKGSYYSDCSDEGLSKMGTEMLPKDWQDQAKKLWEVSEDLVKDYLS